MLLFRKINSLVLNELFATQLIIIALNSKRDFS